MIEQIMEMSKDAATLEIDDNFEASRRLTTQAIAFAKVAQEFKMRAKEIKWGIKKKRGRKYD